MSSIGGPIAASVVQVANAQQQAARARDRERVAASPPRSVRDMVDLRVAGVEDASSAVRGLGRHDGEESGAKRRKPGPRPDPPDKKPPQVDVTA